jgi:hypothetical protein
MDAISAGVSKPSSTRDSPAAAASEHDQSTATTSRPNLFTVPASTRMQWDRLETCPTALPLLREAAASLPRGDEQKAPERLLAFSISVAKEELAGAPAGISV